MLLFLSHIKATSSLFLACPQVSFGSHLFWGVYQPRNSLLPFLNMSSIMKVVFPMPPPTTNDLSSHQRTQLRRKAMKLEQIFGATPRLLDNTSEPIRAGESLDILL